MCCRVGRHVETGRSASTSVMNGVHPGRPSRGARMLDFLPDGLLLVVLGRGHQLLRREPDGSLMTHVDLGGVSEKPWNDIVVDGRGNTYVNNIGFDFPGGEVTTGVVALITPDGAARQVADGVQFPNGMAVTADNSTL